MLGNGFVNMDGVRVLSSKHHSGGPQLVIQQPPLFGDSAPVSNQATVLSDHPVTRDQDSQVVRGYQPANLPGVQPGGPGDVVVRAGLAQRNLAQGLQYGDLGRGEIEPTPE